MIENVLDKFADNVFQFVTGKSKTGRSLLVKKHSENLHLHGDFSFPNTLKPWHEYLNKSVSLDNDNCTVMSFIGKQITDINVESQNWALEVNKAQEEKGRIHLFLNRVKSTRIGLTEALGNNIELSEQMRQITNKVSEDILNDDSLTSLRLNYLTKSIKNLYSIYSSRNKSTRGPSVIVTSKSSFRSEDGCVVLCGAVLNSQTGAKETNMKVDDYLR